MLVTADVTPRGRASSARVYAYAHTYAEITRSLFTWSVEHGQCARVTVEPQRRKDYHHHSDDKNDFIVHYCFAR